MMKNPKTDSTRRMRRLIFLICFGLFGFSSPGGSGEFDSLYLRDGSILKGTILRQTTGDYLVYSPYGELSVGAGEVIHMTRPEPIPPVIDETHIFLDDLFESISIVKQDLPKRREGVGSFNLLMPGVVDTILTDGDDEVLFNSRLVGENTLVTIEYANLPTKTEYLRITLWQFDLLTPLDTESAKFQRKYTPDQAGVVYVLVKYPKDWQVRGVTPAPTKQFDGLIVWRQELKRQQNFVPEAVFQFTKRPSTAPPSPSTPQATP